MSYYSGGKLLHVLNGIGVLQMVWVPDRGAVFKFGQDGCTKDLVVIWSEKSGQDDEDGVWLSGKSVQYAQCYS